MIKTDYGKFTVTIKGKKKTVRAEKWKTLIEVLASNGIFLRSDCGGKGLCGKCLVLLNGKKELGPACGVRFSGDLTVEIPDDSFLRPEVVRKGPMILPEPIPFRALLQDAADRYGLAVDLGTTTIAVYLCDLVSGKVKGSVSVRNPQAIFGDDVISRISRVAENTSDLPHLQKMAVKAIEWCVTSLCRTSRISPGHIRSAVIAGNSIMIHLFSGENPSSIGVFPYVPLFVEKKIFRADAVGFEFNPSADIFTLPLISGFLGSDILAAALATELDKAPSGTMLVDIGTNGEIMLKSSKGLFAASCATGPAFEGATIRHGMHAVSGAIDSVKIDGKSGGVTCSVIQTYRNGGKKLPSGICGSGIISAVAELCRCGLLLKSGRFNPDADSSLFRAGQNGLMEFELVPAEKSGTGRAITLTQKDIREIQLAKAALLSGITMLCSATGLTVPKKLLVAGAFGTFIDKKDALTIGMFPDIPEENITVIGNGAGAGAVLALFNPAILERSKELARAAKVLDLAASPEFQEVFLNSLQFPEST
jgi:uncharacterized 2Fe-2S/4Fe-4S cluster protein (DUF4445 family)